MSSAVDILAQDEGTIWVLSPVTDRAKHWIEEHVEVQTTWGDGIVVEHRYVHDLVEGAMFDGLTVAPR
jgi:hypothetical protein